MTQEPQNNSQIEVMRRITCFIFLFCLFVNPQAVDPDETNDPVITDVAPSSGVLTDPRILMIATTRGSLVPAKIDEDISVQELHAYHYRRYNADYSCYAMIENDMFIIGGSGVGCKPFQEKFLEIGILCSSDSVFSPDSEYGFQKS